MRRGDAVCNPGKLRYTGAAARAKAAERRAAGDHAIEAYRCPVCRRWHLGHAMTLATIAARARAIRERSGNAPGVRCQCGRLYPHRADADACTARNHTKEEACPSNAE